MKKIVLWSFLMLGVSASAQEKIQVKEFNLAGPFAVAAPVGMDTVDVNGKKFDEKSLMDNLSLSSEPTSVFSGQVLPSLKDSKSVGVLSFYVNNQDYLKGKIEVKGPKNYKLFIDGKEAGGVAQCRAILLAVGEFAHHRRAATTILYGCTNRISSP